MATTLLLIVIYIAFISLGLPDAILGVAWPIMRTDFNLPLDAQGSIFIVTTVATILSSIASGYLIRKFKTYRITLFSVFLTAIALLGISYSPSFYWIILLAFPLGFGAGSIDTALNNYVALHFESHHMNWLHAFWGIGATLGPMIMSLFFSLQFSWRTGYFTLSMVQIVFFIIILISFPLWNKHNGKTVNTEELDFDEPVSYLDVLKTKGVLLSMMMFVAYCAIEFIIGQWGASYLVSERTMTVSTAGTLVGIYYIGITMGRILSGFISITVQNGKLIIGGIILFILSSFIIFIDAPYYILFVGFLLQGMGLAPIFPSLTHETPKRFGKQKSQSVIGFQMASAYVGASIFPALFGVIARYTNIGIYPFVGVGFGITLLLINQLLLHKIKES